MSILLLQTYLSKIDSFFISIDIKIIAIKKKKKLCILNVSSESNL